MERQQAIIAIVTDRYYQYQADIVEYLATELKAIGYASLCIAGSELSPLTPPYPAHAVCNAVYPQINDFGVSGIISLSGTIGHGVGQETVKQFLASFDLPKVSLGMEVPGVPSVCLDELSGMGDLMQHLLSDPKRRRFAFVRGHKDDHFSLVREAIFRQSLQVAGLDHYAMHYLEGDYNPFDTYDLVSKLLADYPVDCIVACNDVMAASAGRAVKALGFSIPGDIAISGFDDTREATNHSPALSTVRQPLKKMSDRAIALLLKQIEKTSNVTADEQLLHVLPTELIVRRSTQSSNTELDLSASFNEPALRALLNERMDGLDLPDSLTMHDVSIPLWETIERGSTKLLQVTEDIDDRLITKHAHWWINLADQVQSISDNLPNNERHLRNTAVITSAVSKVKERIWALEMDNQFENTRLQNCRADFLLALSSCNSLDDIGKAMDDWLDQLKPSKCFMVRYEHMGPMPHKYSQLLHVHRNGINESIEAVRFETTKLLPEQYKSELNDSLVVFCPLYADNNLYGYLLIDPVELKFHYTAAAALSIGNAMRTQFHVESLQQQKESLESINNELAHIANYDALTGLANRLQFQQYLEDCCDNLQTDSDDESGFALLFIDLDGFKLINDTLGHSAGDLLLNEVAQRLIACVDQARHFHGFISRLGGDEFTVILHPENGDASVTELTNNILNSLSSAYQLDQTNVSISASIGVVYYPEDAKYAGILVQHADIAMYKAKDNGKNSVVRFTPALVSDDKQALQLMQELRNALENHQLRMHYQPRIDLRSGKICTVEALIRWLVPTESGLQVRARPDEFVPLAEKVGLISQLDTYALHYSCKQAALWSAAGTPITVSVNVSVMQLQQDSFVDTIKNALQVHQLESGLLELEITESAAMTEVESNIRKLSELKALGIHISIDDFGTGYSSLNYLKRLPVDNLKIDSSFMVDIDEHNGGDSPDASIVRSVVALGKSMGFGLVAEGIETEQQASFVQALGCDEVQGYLYSQAVPATDITQMLNDGKQFLKLPANNNNKAA